MDQKANSMLHFTFMFAMPLVFEMVDQSGGIRIDPMQAIDYYSEYLNVQSALKYSKKQIKYRKVSGTVSNLIKVINQDTRGLHFAGHGFKQSNQIKSIKDYDTAIRDQGDILIFEDEERGNSLPFYLSE